MDSPVFLETREHMLRGGPEYALKLLTEAFGAQRAEALLVLSADI
jgi:flagellar motor switch protein FliG